MGGKLEKNRVLFSTSCLALAKAVSKHCHLYDTTSTLHEAPFPRENLANLRLRKPYSQRSPMVSYTEEHTSEETQYEPSYYGVPLTCTSQDYLKYVKVRGIRTVHPKLETTKSCCRTLSPMALVARRMEALGLGEWD